MTPTNVPPATTVPTLARTASASAGLDFDRSVAFGVYSNWMQMRRIAFADDVNNTEVHVNPLNALIPLPTSGVQMEFLSTSAQDGPNGTGAQSVLLRYLDSNYVQKDEFITMNGTNVVQTVTTDVFRPQQIATNVCGSGQCAAGNILMRRASAGSSQMQIRAGRNTAQAGYATVPVNMKVYLTNFHVAVTVGGAASACVDVRLGLSMNENFVVTPNRFYTHDIITLADGSSVVNYPSPMYVPPKCDMRITAVGNAGNIHAHVSARLGYLIHFFNE